jgi:hypothetical protein
MKQIDPFLVRLCRQIEISNKRSIKEFMDAKWLSQQMEVRKIFVSPHTIARLFGVIKPFRKPYKVTLNGLAQFLDYFDWEDYVKNQTTLYTDPNFFLTESNDGFSQSVLELALITKQYDTVKQLMDKYVFHAFDNTFMSSAALIGAYLKTNNYDKKLLQILAESDSGQRLFYECFVDEDNEDNYFSEALLNYYLPKIKNPGRKIFVYTFVISQTAYKENRVSEYFKNFREVTQLQKKEETHYHEYSRWIECNIIHDGFNCMLKDTFSQHIEAILSYSSEDFEPEWVVIRPLRALLFFGFKNELFNHKELNDYIKSILFKTNKHKDSIPMYVLQLFWLCREKKYRRKNTYNPFRKSINYFHSDNNEKLAIEFATASLFAAGENKAFLDKNLEWFCKQKGKQWVLNLLQE